MLYSEGGVGRKLAGREIRREVVDAVGVRVMVNYVCIASCRLPCHYGQHLYGKQYLPNPFFGFVFQI